MDAKENGNRLAYPTYVGDVGLTKRELFAAMAMQGNCSKFETTSAMLAKWSVEDADALLAELAKEQK